MEKEIPNSKEKKGRLRDAARFLLALPVDRLPSQSEWDEITGDLTADDLERLNDLAQGHFDRALEAEGAAEGLEEAASAVLLRPRDPDWSRTVVTALRKKAWTGDEAHAFFTAVDRRTGASRRASGGLPRWLVPVLGLVLLVPLGTWGVLVLWPSMSLASPLKAGQGPRTLESAFDTQGVKANIRVAASRLVVYPEATVAELSAWVSFPDHRIDLWEGKVSALSAAGEVLTSREVVFRSSSQGPIDPGQGVEVFQQFDAWPWFDRVASLQISTTRILAQEAHPRNRQELPLTGSEALTPGYKLKVWLVESRWSERFAARIHSLSLELENAGLKSFANLELALVWIDAKGKVLKTQVLRPVSAFRTALPSGARLPWTQETVFDTEVFSWDPGSEPHPVLELRQWD